MKEFIAHFIEIQERIEKINHSDDCIKLNNNQGCDLCKLLSRVSSGEYIFREGLREEAQAIIKNYILNTSTYTNKFDEYIKIYLLFVKKDTIKIFLKRYGSDETKKIIHEMEKYRSMYKYSPPANEEINLNLAINLSVLVTIEELPLLFKEHGEPNLRYKKEKEYKYLDYELESKDKFQKKSFLRFVRVCLNTKADIIISNHLRVDFTKNLHVMEVSKEGFRVSERVIRSIYEHGFIKEVSFKGCESSAYRHVEIDGEIVVVTEVEMISNNLKEVTVCFDKEKDSWRKATEQEEKATNDWWKNWKKDHPYYYL